MAADGPGRATLYLASCDPRERTPEGEPLVVNGELKSPKGHPALIWGCGPLIRVEPNKPRWLVLSAEDSDVELLTWGALVRKGRVHFDGELRAAVRFMAEQSPLTRPFITQVRRGEDYDVLAVGSLGHIDAKAHLVGATGTDAKVKADVGSVIAVGLRSHVKAAADEKERSSQKGGAGDFCIVAGGDNSTLEVGRYSTAAVGNAGKIVAKAGSVVAGASLTDIVVGTCGRALVESAGSIDLGEQAVGVGTSTTRFRGAARAVFVAVNAIDGGETFVATARVGVGDIKENTWYVFQDGKFARADA
jgi:hypothetical protein